MSNEQDMIDDPDILKHWYAFSFQTGEKQGSAYVGYLERGRITAARIAAAQGVSGMGPRCVLMGVSYLGRMSRTVFVEGMVEEPQKKEDV